MAPTHSAKPENQRRIASILEFASQLQTRLESNVLPPSLATELSQHLAKSFPKPDDSKIRDLDDRGRALWNTSIQSQQRDIDIPGLSAQLRAFAFYLLDCAYRAFSKNEQSASENLVRILRVALKTARACISENQLDLANQVFQRAATYVEMRNKENGPKVNPEDESERIIQSLTAEYYLLRATQSWKSDRLDLVKFWLSKAVIRDDDGENVALIEKKADFLYEVGKSELKKKKFGLAVNWLQKSYDTIELVDQPSFTPDRDELRLAIMSDLARALVETGDADSLSKSSEMVTRMESELPEFRMSISLLRLRCLFAQSPVDIEHASTVILHIISLVYLIDNNIKTVLHQIHQLKKANEIDKKPDGHSISHACKALESFLPRLYDLGSQSWIEKAVVTRIWLGVITTPTLASAQKLEELFQETHSSTGTPFSTEATHAAQSLIWKLIDTPITAHPEAPPAVWCRLAGHALFQKAGDLNKSKLRRKMILDALANGDTDTAREAYFAMPESGKAAPITKYIMYKVALRSGDAELASDSLDGVLKATSTDPTFLYACTLEAQQAGDTKQAIVTLQKVLECYDQDAPKGIYLPALLRATVNLLVREMERDTAPDPNASIEVCKIFEGAMSQAGNFRSTESGALDKQYQAELKWFASRGYNLALKHMTDMHPELLVRFMTVCISFIDMLRSEDGKDSGLAYRSLLCRFLAVSSLVILGRTEDNVERSLSHYLEARRQIEAFHQCFAEATNSNKFQADTLANLIIKDFELLKYDLEALLRLKHWDDLDRVLGLCLADQHSTRLGTVADLVIHIHTEIVNERLDNHYQTKIPLVTERIINACWKQDKSNVQKLARWTRCLYQMTVNLNPAMALKCVESAKTIAARARATHEPKLYYPKEELLWLATSAFNHAIDVFCAGDKEDGRLWAENALNLAMVAGKDAGLHENLQKKWIGVQTKAQEQDRRANGVQI